MGRIVILLDVRGVLWGWAMDHGEIYNFAISEDTIAIKGFGRAIDAVTGMVVLVGLLRGADDSLQGLHFFTLALIGLVEVFQCPPTLHQMIE